MRPTIVSYLTAIMALAMSVCACNDDEEFTTDPAATISFSRDTVSFDTIFTKTISVTERFCVYNRGSKSVRLASVALASGGTSGFMINVDGQSGEVVRDVPISDGDSIFVFVKVKLDEQHSDRPVLNSDDIVFTLESGVESSVRVEASGQDCEAKQGYTLTRDTTLTSVGLPLVVFDSLVVAENATLTMEEGTTLYFHNGANLVVRGSLKVRGTKDNPVTFRGDRLDWMFSYLPYDRLNNQWGGIMFMPSSCGINIDYADIHSGSGGIECKQVKDLLTITNTVIHNMGGYGLRLEDCNATVANSQITNCKYDCVNIVGGNTQFYHCTIGQFYPWSANRGCGLAIYDFISSGEDGEDGDPVMHPIEQSQFYNCFVTGYSKDEVYAFYKGDKEELNVNFHNCVLLTDLKDEKFFDSCVTDHKDSLKYQQTNFRTFDTHAFIYDFRLDSLSTARGKGSTEYSRLYPTDMDGNPREDKPDAGCYQYVGGEVRKE